ncbi:MAG: hypothetical protein AAF228_13995, partial [Pseudomonadota bacterium]
NLDVSENRVWLNTADIIANDNLEFNQETGELTIISDTEALLSTDETASLELKTDDTTGEQSLVVTRSGAPETPLFEFAYSSDNTVTMETLFGDQGTIHGPHKRILKPGESFGPDTSLNASNETDDIYLRAIQLDTHDEDGNAITEYRMFMISETTGQVFDRTDRFLTDDFDRSTGELSIAADAKYQYKLSPSNGGVIAEKYVSIKDAYFGERNIVGSSLDGGELTEDQLLADDTHRYFFGAIQRDDETPDDATDDVYDFVLLDHNTGQHVAVDSGGHDFFDASTGKITLASGQRLEIDTSGQLKLLEGSSEEILGDITDYSAAAAATLFTKWASGTAAFIFKAIVELTSDDLSDTDNDEQMVAEILTEMTRLSSDTSAEDLIANMTFRNSGRVLTELVNGDGEADDLAAAQETIKELSPSDAADRLEMMDNDYIIKILKDFDVATISNIYMQMSSGNQAIAELIETERSSPSDAPSEQPAYTYASTPDIGLVPDGETHSEKIAIQLPDGTWSYGTGEEITITKTNPDTGGEYDIEQPVLVANVKGIDGFLTEGLRRIVPIETERGLNYMLVHSNGDLIPEIIVVPPSDLTDATASWLALAAQDGDVTAETTEILTEPLVDDTLYIRLYENVGELGDPEEVFNARRLATTVVDQWGPEAALEEFVSQEAPNVLTLLRNFLAGMDETQPQSADDIKHLMDLFNKFNIEQGTSLKYREKVKIGHIFTKHVTDNNLDFKEEIKTYQIAWQFLAFNVKPDMRRGISAPAPIQKIMQKIRRDIISQLRSTPGADPAYTVLDDLKEWDELSAQAKSVQVNIIQVIIKDYIVPIMSKAYDVPTPNVEFVQFTGDSQSTEAAYTLGENNLMISQQFLKSASVVDVISLISHEFVHAWQDKNFKAHPIESFDYNAFPAGILKDHAVLINFSFKHSDFIRLKVENSMYGFSWHELQAYDMQLNMGQIMQKELGKF